MDWGRTKQALREIVFRSPNSPPPLRHHTFLQGVVRRVAMVDVAVEDAQEDKPHKSRAWHAGTPAAHQETPGNGGAKGGASTKTTI
jgi:hypothetical protein